MIVEIQSNAESSISDCNVTACDVESDLDKTSTSQICGQDYVTKQRTLEEDINDELFVGTEYIQPSKRKGKVSELPYESITFDIYQQKKCGFLTERPLIWAKAFEWYINETPNVIVKWNYKMENGRYFECELMLYYEKTKKVVINISVRTGVVLIKGQYFKEWTNLVFTNLLNYVNNGDLGESVKLIQGEDKVSEAKEDRNDIKKLWEECSSLKSGLCTLETSVANVIQSNQDVCELVNRKFKEIDQKVRSLESMYDNKLVCFMSAVSIDCQDLITRNCQSIKEDIIGQKKFMSKMESRFQKSLNQIQKNVSVCESTENTPGWVDLEAVKKTALSVQQSVCNDVENLKAACKNMESQIRSLKSAQYSLQNTNIDEAKPVDTTDNVKTLNSRCGTIEVKVDSLGTALSNCATSQVVESLKKEIQIAQHNISIMKKSQVQPTVTPVQENVAIPQEVPHQAEKNVTKDNSEKITRMNPADIMHNVDLLICMDSNQKFIDRGRFWKLKGTIWKKTTRLEHIENLFRNESFSDLKGVLISCGVNDIDRETGKDVAERIINIVSEIKIAYPSVKVVLSEVTPRKDVRDEEVHKCNSILATFMSTFEDGTFVRQDNLRDPNWSMYYDVKHIRKNKIAKLVGNLKQGLRATFSTSNATENGDFATGNYTDFNHPQSSTSRSQDPVLYYKDQSQLHMQSSRNMPIPPYVSQNWSRGVNDSVSSKHIPMLPGANDHTRQDNFYSNDGYVRQPGFDVSHSNGNGYSLYMKQRNILLKISEALRDL